jgi:hypothetical protein
MVRVVVASLNSPFLPRCTPPRALQALRRVLHSLSALSRRLPVVPSRPAIHRLAGRLDPEAEVRYGIKLSDSAYMQLEFARRDACVMFLAPRGPVAGLRGQALPGAVPGITLAHPSLLQLRLSFNWLDCEILLRYGMVFPYQAVPMGNCCSAPTATQAPTQPEVPPLHSHCETLCYAIPPPVMPAICLKKCLAIIMWSVMKIMNPRLCQLCSVASLKKYIDNLCLMSTFVLLASLCMTICVLVLLEKSTLCFSWLLQLLASMLICCMCNIDFFNTHTN